ncbi:MAG: DMT family transporter [Clostridia bacterium]|nr:DMT family transporter [Clostridia bacterium]
MKINPKLIVLVGALGVSGSPIFIKLSSSPALTIAFYRMLFTILLLTPYIIYKNRDELKSVSKINLLKTGISGVFLGCHFSFWILSLKYTTVASATILVNTSPILLLIINILIFRHVITRKEITSIIIAFSGSILLAYGDFFGGNEALMGDTFAIMGAGFVCVYLILGKQVRKDLSMTSYTYLTYAFATLTIFILNLFIQHSLVITSSKEISLFIAMAVFPTLLGHSLFNWALKYVSETYVAMAILLEPILASIIAYFLFEELPSTIQLIGAATVLIGIILYNKALESKSITRSSS